MARPAKAQTHIGVKGYPVPAEELPVWETFRLTKDMVLAAVAKAVSPDSAYINDEVQKMHRSHVASGGKGFPPRTSLVLSRLNSLTVDGLLEKSRFTNGYYGYRWSITPSGRDALASLDQEPGQ